MWLSWYVIYATNTKKTDDPEALLDEYYEEQKVKKGAPTKKKMRVTSNAMDRDDTILVCI